MLSIFRHLMSNDQGAALIAVTVIAAMGSVDTKVNGVLSNVASTMR